MRSAAITSTGSEAGATMLEFALVAVVLFGVLGAIFDVGLALHHRSYLQHLTSDAVHELAACGTGMRNCNVYAKDQCVAQVLAPKLALLQNAFAAGSGTTWRYTFALNGPSPSIQLNASMPLECFFLCRFLGANSRISVSALGSVETSWNANCGAGSYP